MFAAIGIFALLGYLLGSVNFAVLVAKKHGIDILKEGSGNPGATNVKRVLGKGPGNLVFALDALKGFVGAGLPYLLLSIDPNQPAINDLFFVVCVAGLVGTLLGHCFSCFLKFKGGKGVASTIGGLLVLLPIPIVIGAAIWVVFLEVARDMPFIQQHPELRFMALGILLVVLMIFRPQGLLGQKRQPLMMS